MAGCDVVKHFCLASMRIRATMVRAACFSLVVDDVVALMNVPVVKRIEMLPAGQVLANICRRRRDRGFRGETHACMQRWQLGTKSGLRTDELWRARQAALLSAFICKEISENHTV